MACKFGSDESCFSFIWILENFEYCAWESCASPMFIVDAIERTKWSLMIYPRGNGSERCISLFLHRTVDSKGPANIEIDYELAFLASDGSVLTLESGYQQGFLKGSSSGFTEFEKREPVTAKQSMFLTQGALTIRCRMWKRYGEAMSDGQCIARTRISVERKAFLCKIIPFSNFHVGQEFRFRLKSTSDDTPIASVILFLRKTRKSKTKSIHVEIVNSNQSIVFSTLKPSLVDSKEDYVDCGQYEFLFSPHVQNYECKLSLLAEKLIDNSSLYLPNDVLTLHLEYAFTLGIAFQGIEDTTLGCSGSFISKNGVSENIKTATIDKSVSDTLSDLKMDLGSMLQDNILCDVKLCTESETFYAHWIILSARSPVFRAMFTSNMKEKTKDRIDIEDLKPDTVRRMLLYMYTNSFEELQWEAASDLYVAAEKYQIMSLKDKCSSFLKNNLSPANVCEILLIADLHQDKELKSTVQDFILKNDKSIINSSEWKLLMGANVHLAAETMALRFKE